MKVILVTLLCGLATFVKAEVEVYFPDYFAGAPDDHYDRFISEFSEFAAVDRVSFRLVPFDQLEVTLGRMSGEAVIELPPNFFNRAVDAGLVPLFRYDGQVAIGLYALAPVDEITTYATPKVTTLAAVVGDRMAGDARVTRTADHANCIRATVIGQVDACATAPFFVNQYRQTYGIELVALKGPVRAPPIVLFATPSLAERLRLAITPGVSIAGVGRFTYLPFVEARDKALYADF